MMTMVWTELPEELINEMDFVFDHDEQFRRQLGCIRLAQMLDQDNQEALAEIAEARGWTHEQVLAYAGLQAFVTEYPAQDDQFDSPEISDTPETVAMAIGMPLRQFRSYLHRRSDVVGLQKMQVMTEDCFPWETPQDQLADLIGCADLDW